MKAGDKEFKARQGYKGLLKSKTSKQGKKNIRVTMYREITFVGNPQTQSGEEWGLGVYGEPELQERVEAENPSHRLLGAWELDKVVALNKCFLR